ncbi:MAG TPA: CBS domain-containing protein [Eudoraea sp.]|nr:CBS domain-containing protein [Eudoraea sp.]
MKTDRLVAEDFIAKYPFRAAQVLEGLNDDEVAELMRELRSEHTLTLLNVMNVEKASRCFALLPTELASELMEASDIFLAESLCRQFDETYLTRLLSNLSPDLTAAINRKLEQAENTVGVLMVPVIVVNKEMTVKDAFEIIRRNKESLESYLYVVDTSGTFEGAVRLEELLYADRNITLAELMITTIPKFFPDTPIKNILDHPAWYEYRFIPIVDRSEKLLGTLPYRTTREITIKKSGPRTKDLLDTSVALGELYRIGLTGFLQSVGK